MGVCLCLCLCVALGEMRAQALCLSLLPRRHQCDLTADPDFALPVSLHTPFTPASLPLLLSRLVHSLPPCFQTLIVNYTHAKTQAPKLLIEQIAVWWHSSALTSWTEASCQLMGAKHHKWHPFTGKLSRANIYKYIDRRSFSRVDLTFISVCSLKIGYSLTNLQE